MAAVHIIYLAVEFSQMCHKFLYMPIYASIIVA